MSARTSLRGIRLLTNEERAWWRDYRATLTPKQIQDSRRVRSFRGRLALQRYLATERTIERDGKSYRFPPHDKSVWLETLRGWWSMKMHTLAHKLGTRDRETDCTVGPLGKHRGCTTKCIEQRWFPD